jgi:hypothetical protein
VSFQDVQGNALPLQRVFDQLREKILGAKTEQEAISMAAEVFGRRAAPAAVAAMKEMGGSTNEAIDKYRALGLIIGSETPEKLDNLGTAMANLGRVIIGAIADAVAYVGPALTKMLEAVTEALNWVFQQIGKMIDYVVSAGRTVGSNLRSLGQAAGLVASTPLETARRGLDAATNNANAAAKKFGEAQAAYDRAVAGGTEDSSRSLQVTGQRLEKARRDLQEAGRRLAEANASVASLTPPEATTPTVTVTAPAPAAAAPPRVTAGGGGSGGKSDAEKELERQLKEMERAINQLYESTRTPMEEFHIKLQKLWEVSAAAGQNGLPALAGGMETVRRAVLEYAESAATALSRLGDEGRPQIEALRAELEGLGPRLLDSGAISDIEQWVNQVNQTLSKVGKKEDGTGFFTNFMKGFGIQDPSSIQSFGDMMGAGLGKEFSGLFDNMFSMFESIANGSKKAGDAIKEFALNFVKAIAKMAAQAAAMQLIKSFFGGMGGGGPQFSPGKVPGFGGIKMAGGAVAGGYTYLVGERGPELFTTPGSGRIVPNSELGGGGFNVIVNQNAPGVVVKQQKVDERTVMLAVNMARQQVQADYRESMNKGSGAYSEGLAGRYNVRRRV